jgi:peptidoglycan/LPS O-acetylase OafA/YrhL
VHHPQPSPTRIRYLPALDGLRGIAVLAVIFYHAELSWMPGGFLGVELFFVVSGFLITSLLLSELRGTGAIDLRHFWVRRARRLLPALFLLLAAVALVVRFALPEEIPQTRSDLLAAMFYVTNWELIFTGQSYFEAVGRPPLLQHLWSLAVEEQYYLLWPLAVAGLARLGGRRAVAIACAVGAVASTALMWLLVDPDAPSRVYYGTDTRAAGLLIGGLLAATMIGIRAPRPDASARRVIDVVGGSALVVLVLLMLRTSEFDTGLYRGGFLRFALLTVVVLFTVTVPGSLVARGLATKALVAVGVRSYGLYLWHWPVFQLTRPGIDVGFDGPALLAFRLAVTVALTEASLRLVEQPIRDGALGRWWERERERAGGAVWSSTGVRRATGGATLGVVALAGLYVVTPTSASPELLASEIGIVTPTTVIAPSPVGTIASAPTTTIPTSPDDGPRVIPTLPPTTEPSGPPGATARPVYAIGDSVLLAASQAVASEFGGSVTVDGKVGRQPWTGTDLVEAWAGANPGVDLLVSLGNNGILRADDVDRIMAAAGPDRRVAFVNVHVPRRWERATNEALADRVAAYPNAVLLDWYGRVQQDGSLVGRDRIHPTTSGAAAYAALVRSAFD